MQLKNSSLCSCGKGALQQGCVEAFWVMKALSSDEPPHEHRPLPLTLPIEPMDLHLYFFFAGTTSIKTYGVVCLHISFLH